MNYWPLIKFLLASHFIVWRHFMLFSYLDFQLIYKIVKGFPEAYRRLTNWSKASTNLCTRLITIKNLYILLTKNLSTSLYNQKSFNNISQCLWAYELENENIILWKIYIPMSYPSLLCPLSANFSRWFFLKYYKRQFKLF